MLARIGTSGHQMLIVNVFQTTKNYDDCYMRRANNEHCETSQGYFLLNLFTEQPLASLKEHEIFIFIRTMAKSFTI